MTVGLGGRVLAIGEFCVSARLLRGDNSVGAAEQDISSMVKMIRLRVFFMFFTLWRA